MKRLPYSEKSYKEIDVIDLCSFVYDFYGLTIEDDYHYNLLADWELSEDCCYVYHIHEHEKLLDFEQKQIGEFKRTNGRSSIDQNTLFVDMYVNGIIEYGDYLLRVY